METNPFLSREIRTRWRDFGPYRSLAYCVSAAACLVTLLYWQTHGIMAGGRQSGTAAELGSLGLWIMSGRLPSGSNGSVASLALSQFGALLFMTFAWLGTLAALFQIPSLSAAAIAGEREQGTLEALQLSPLGPHRILIGKLAADLLFAGLVYLATLPLASLCLLLNGASPEEFCWVVVTHISTALFGAVAGVTVSSSSHRSTQALRSANRRMTLWFIGTLLAAIFSGPPTLFIPGGLPPTTGPFALNWLVQAFELTNPIQAVVLRLGKPAGGLAGGAIFCVVFQTTPSLVLFAIAAYNVKRPLAQSEWVQWRRPAKPGGSGSFFSPPGMASLQFENPVLNREFRSKFRMRYPPVSVIIFEILLALVVVSAYIYMAFLTWTQPATREYTWGVLAILAFLLGAGPCALMGAVSIARERDNGTWEGLQLALLSPGQVLRGKWQSSWLSCLALSPPLWPLLLMSIRTGATVPGNSQGVHPAQLVSLAMVLASSSFMACALGLYFATYRRTMSATANLTMLTLGAVWGLLPVGIMLFAKIPGRNWYLFEALLECSPVKILLPGAHSAAGIWGGGTLPFTTASVLLGLLLLQVASRRLAREWRVD